MTEGAKSFVNFRLRGNVTLPVVGPNRLERSPEELSELLGGPPITTILSETARRSDNVVITVRIALQAEEEEATIDFNYHLDAAGDDIERTKLLSQHIRRAPDFYEDARRIAKRIIQ